MNNEAMEVIRDDIYAFDFNRAKSLNIKVSENNYEVFSKQNWCKTTNGKIVLNKVDENYDAFKAVFLFLAEKTIDELEDEYKRLEQLYVNDKEIKDMNKYCDIIDKANVMFKVFIPIEISKRKSGEKAIQQTLKCLTILN